MNNEEKDFFKTCFNIVASLEVTNESQSIAKEVILKEVDNLQQENKQLKDSWKELREIIRKKQDYYRNFKDNRYRKFLSELLNKMQELQGSDSDVED